MLEYPLAIMVSVVVMAIVLPYLPPWSVKIALLLASALILQGLYYMIVTPGWRPGSKPMHRTHAILLFSVAALTVITLVTTLILTG